MKRFHNWIMRACKHGINQIEMRCNAQIFKSREIQSLNIGFDDLHLMFQLGWMDISLITAWCL